MADETLKYRGAWKDKAIHAKLDRDYDRAMTKPVTEGQQNRKSIRSAHTEVDNARVKV